MFATATMLAIALVAAYVPARRAARVAAEPKEGDMNRTFRSSLNLRLLVEVHACLGDAGHLCRSCDPCRQYPIDGRGALTRALDEISAGAFIGSNSALVAPVTRIATGRDATGSGVP